MNPVSIEIFNESDEIIPFSEGQFQHVVLLVQKQEKRNFLHVEVVFVNDPEILEMNRRYLGHDHVTDIITFPYHEENEPVEGTLYCCAPEIRRQSTELGTPYDEEVLRVVIHGLLHLVGHDDSTDSQRTRMRSLEDKYITIYRDY